VIEHLHNTRLFVQAIKRVLNRAVCALVTSENLTSFLNTGAMLLGYTPFTLMRVAAGIWEIPLDCITRNMSRKACPSQIRPRGVTVMCAPCRCCRPRTFEKVGFNEK